MKEVVLVLAIIAMVLSCKQNNSSTSEPETQPEEVARRWKAVNFANPPEARHEHAFVALNGKLYLLGGRNALKVEVYDPADKRWQSAAPAPIELHHFQAVVYGGEVYVAGAFTGAYPREKPVPLVYIYNPSQNTWREGPSIPQNRRRGAAGVAVYNEKIYVVGGITDGHYDGHVAWLDEFDPKSGQWRSLPDAPHLRDHFHAAVVGNLLIAAGGRNTSAKTGQVFDLTRPEVDVFDFAANAWRTLPAAQNIPTQRAGCTAVVLDGKVLIIGGESAQKEAHNQTEAFDPASGTWQTLAPMLTGRHGMQAAVFDDKVYVASGSGGQGGGPLLRDMEVLE